MSVIGSQNNGDGCVPLFFGDASVHGAAYDVRFKYPEAGEIGDGCADRLSERMDAVRLARDSDSCDRLFLKFKDDGMRHSSLYDKFRRFS